MKKLIASVIILACIILTLASCNKGNAKQVPVYQGMSIGSASEIASSATLPLYYNGGNGHGGESDGHHEPGHYEGDHDGRNDQLDEENPFPDNSESENIEEEIESSLNVTGPMHDIYYATPNEDIYIYIHIDNPDSFEIMSFTLNGKKYSSYMFEDGSDMETIILKYNVGSESGYVEYTIDAIKYVDGTEIKDVLIDGDKTVRAGIKTENQVVASISDLAIGTNALSFNVNVRDNDGLIAFSSGTLKAVIYDGKSIIAKKDLALGENSVSFDGLKTNTLYQYAIVGYYDDLSGGGFDMYILYKDAFYTDSVVLFDGINIGQENISFGFTWHKDHQNKSLTSLKLYKDGTPVKELDVNATSVDGLLSANTYILVAEYSNNGNTESISIEFTTLAKAEPSVSIINPSSTQDSISFEVEETDADNVGSISKIELIDKDGKVVATNTSVKDFTGLLSNNEYTIKLTYTYNLNDGNGEQTIVSEACLKTEAKSAPSFEIGDADITLDGIKANHTVTDADNTLKGYKFELFKGTTPITDGSKISFSGLTYYTEYTLKLTYTYDLNDDTGVQTGVNEYQYTTLPYIDVTGCNIANTSAVSEGDTIFMQVTLDNPLNMTIESVVINGETYSVTGASTSKKIFVEIVYNGQFEGGNTYLKIDKVNAKIDETSLVATPKSELSDNVFINGKLDVIKVEYVNESFEPINWAFPSENVYVLVTLDNPTGYAIDIINESITELIKIDNNRWYYSTTLGYGWNQENLNSIDYHNEYIEKTIAYTNIQANCYKVASDETIYISTPDALKNMNSGYYYELANDIDLSGIEWHGSYFHGVFEGNGYSIKNMTFVGTISNTDAELGLFSYASGIIQNLFIKEATIIADLSSNDNTTYTAYCGGIAARGDHLIISSCCIDDLSVISVRNSSTGSTAASSAHVGGIFGRGEEEFIILNDNTNYASVSAIAESSSAGGIVGVGNVRYGGKGIVITTSINYGNISSNDNAGGISGGGGCITNCINYGTISGYFATGGIAGWGGNESIANCINLGDVSGSRFTAGIAGQRWNSKLSGCINIGKIESADITSAISGEDNYNVNNCYGIVAYSRYDELCNIEQLNSKEFYTETLGWSGDIWDLSELDVENGKYPKLK